MTRFRVTKTSTVEVEAESATDALVKANREGPADWTTSVVSISRIPDDTGGRGLPRLAERDS